MTTKTLKKKVQAKPAISKFTTPVVDSARDVWRAGLGAVSMAQTESSKLIEQGNQLFDRLVSEGSKLEKKTRHEAETAIGDIRNGVESKLDTVRQQATTNWDSLLGLFDERVSDALDRLGVPTTKDLNKLSGHVQKMSRQATRNWKELENVFDERVSGILNSLHVPGAEDLDKLTGNVQKVSREVADNLQKLESTLEARVAEILDGLGIPTTDDTGKLSAELAKLSRQVAAMEKEIKASTRTAPRKAAATS